VLTAVTRGWLLDGRLRHDQPGTGHRTGLEPVLLAASIPARQGERVLEGGTGSGAALLCLAARIAGVTGVGVERDAAMVEIARANIAANDLAGLSVLHADLTGSSVAGPFDHAFANPPWHDSAGSISADTARESARRGAPDMLVNWVASLVRPLRGRGTITLSIAAASLAAALVACDAAGCGSPSVLPLWPKAGREAKLVLLRAVKGGRGPCRLHAGLVLHEADGRFTPEVEIILRDGAALAFPG
jgi:tRNA1Val (adenine37-N6)-methyltransferase